MNKTSKIIIAGILFAVLSYAGYFIFNVVVYSHRLNYETCKKYLWLFSTQAKNDLDTNFSYSCIQKHDIYNHYIYKNVYYVTIWEFKKLKSIRLSKISINDDLGIEDTKINPGETINVGSSPEITMKYGFDFHNSMNVSLGGDSKIDSSFTMNDFKGFYGTANQMLFSNAEGKPLILFNYTNDKQYGLFIWYKGYGSFYLFIINSDKPFDPQRLIKIFNL
jgi:hypothetical protein